MLFRLLTFLVTALLCSASFAQATVVPPTLDARAWLLIEVGSNQILAAEKIDERLEPASLTKLMTAYLTFSALRQKTLTLDQTLPVSEKAWRMGGSKMFVRVDTRVPVEDLIKGLIVQSGNDASMVLAEAIAGSEENFAEMMNREARRLGMQHSQFRNATGLPDPQHFTTARDLGTLAQALLRDFPEEYARYYSLKEFRYANITQPNRNRLIWIDPSADGMKTGYTEAAGYCLVSSARRDQRRLLAVVLGARSDAGRTSESLKLLNWGFLAHDGVLLYRQQQPVSSLRVWKGSSNQVAAGFERDLVVAVPKGMANRVQVQLVSQQPLVAPVRKGQIVGTLKLTLDGKPLLEHPLPALETVPVAGLFGRAIDAVRLWFN